MHVHCCSMMSAHCCVLAQELLPTDAFRHADATCVQAYIPAEGWGQGCHRPNIGHRAADRSQALGSAFRRWGRCMHRRPCLLQPSPPCHALQIPARKCPDMCTVSYSADCSVRIALQGCHLTSLRYLYLLAEAARMTHVWTVVWESIHSGLMRVKCDWDHAGRPCCLG